MKLFRKREEKNRDICREKNSTGAAEGTERKNRIFILGSGCSKCIELENNVLAAVSQLKLEASVGHITDFSEIAKYGVMSTPALVLNGKAAVCGRVLSIEEIKAVLKNNLL